MRPLTPPFLSVCLCIAFRPHRFAVAATLDTAARVFRLPSSVPFVELAGEEVFSLRVKKPLPIDPVLLLIEFLLLDGADELGGALSLSALPVEEAV